MNESIKCKLCENSSSLINYKHKLYLCSSCKLIFHSEIYSQGELEAIYDKLYNNKINPLYARHSINEFKVLKNGKIPNIGYYRKKIIKKGIISNSNQRVIEIGCGVGLIGKFLQNNYNVDYTGIELDNDTANKARGLDLDVICGDFRMIKTIKSGIDVLMLWEVLEHLQDLKSFFNIIRKSLNSGGIIMMSVPNFNKINNYKIDTKRLNYRLYQDAPPIHLNFFTIESLTTIFNDYGFEIEFSLVKPYPYYSPLKYDYYLNLYKAINKKFQGPTIYMIAKKI